MGKFNVLSDILGGQTQQWPSVFADLFVKDETRTQTLVYRVMLSHIQKPEVSAISPSASQSGY